MTKTHRYEATVTWTGNRGDGTVSFRAYTRSHEITSGAKTPIAGSSDPSFLGDAGRWNPEELLVASLSQCHMLWYLHLCADNRVVVTEYVDHPVGTMAENPDGSGQFTDVVLRPEIAVTAAESVSRATMLHERAHQMCFIARSVNFPVRCEPKVRSL